MTRALVAVAAALAAASTAGAQAREHRSYDADEGEGKLMLYYSSTLAFSPLGVAVPDRSGRARLEAAVELSYVPPLSAEQRTVSSDKPQATNLAPLFARPRVTFTHPSGFAVEASWIPPVRVFDVKANVASAAVSRTFGPVGRFVLVPRVSVLAGRVEGPITCNAETAGDGGAALQTYYAFVCHGHDSADFFEPLHVSGEVIATVGDDGGRWRPYVSVGVRHETTEFDIGVVDSQGRRDPEHPVLEIRATRAYGAAGVSWQTTARSRVAVEMYYAPGSVLTVRALAGLRPW